jgi:hypothetical protein
LERQHMAVATAAQAIQQTLALVAVAGPVGSMAQVPLAVVPPQAIIKVLAVVVAGTARLERGLAAHRRVERAGLAAKTMARQKPVKLGRAALLEQQARFLVQVLRQTPLVAVEVVVLATRPPGLAATVVRGQNLIAPTVPVEALVVVEKTMRTHQAQAVRAVTMVQVGVVQTSIPLMLTAARGRRDLSF